MPTPFSGTLDYGIIPLHYRYTGRQVIAVTNEVLPKFRSNVILTKNGSGFRHADRQLDSAAKQNVEDTDNPATTPLGGFQPGVSLDQLVASLASWIMYTRTGTDVGSASLLACSREEDTLKTA